MEPRHNHRRLLRWTTACLIASAGVLAVTPVHAAPLVVATEEPDAVTPTQLREVRSEFSDVTQGLDQQARDLRALAVGSDDWMSGITGNDPGTGLPWAEVIAQQLSEAQSDVSRMRTESRDIAGVISRALSALRNDNPDLAFRMTQSVAVMVNRLTDDAANSGKNISTTLGSATPMLERVGNTGGLQRFASSLQLQSALMRGLRQTEAAIPSDAFPNALPGDVEPAEITSARRDFRLVTSSLDQQLAGVTYLLASKDVWGQGSQATDPGTGLPWGEVLGQKVEISRSDLQRLDMQSDFIASSLTRAFRSARQDNEGGIRLALRSASRDLQQLLRDAQGTGNNLAMTLNSTRPLLEIVGDQNGLRKIADSLHLQTNLLNQIQLSQQSVNQTLR